MKIVLFIIFFPFFTLAAPSPATSSSSLITPQTDILHSYDGFQLLLKSSDWDLTPLDLLLSDEQLEELTSYTNNKYKLSRFTITTHQLEKAMKLNSYINSWMRDYNHLGFQVLGRKNVNVNNSTGVLIDIVANNDRQLRQVVFLKSKKVVILTCSDQKITFKESLSECNKVIRSFMWLN